MELTEVASAHFAMPVVGVLVLAVLVFAFGFKSPEQPPSFDLLDDDKKRKKSDKAKIKKQTNGHAVNIPEVPSVVVAAKPVSPKAGSKSPVASEKHDKGDQSNKTKTPKRNNVQKAALKVEVVPSTQNKSKEINNGEWTTAVSRKNKRSKKDERKDDPGYPVVPVPQPVTPPAAAKPAMIKEETPKPQRAGKKENKAKDSPKPESKKAAPKQATPTKPEAVVESVIEAAPPAEPEPDVEPEPVIVEAPQPTPTSYTSIAEAVESEQASAVVDSIKTSPKKNKKKKKASQEVIKDDKPVETPPTEAGPSNKLPEPKQEEEPKPAAMGDASCSSPEAFKSPNKKNKKKSKESRDKFYQELLSSDSSHKPETSQVSGTQSQEKMKSSSSTTVKEPVVSTEVQGNIAAGGEQSTASSSNPDGTPVTFDELGDWQEAKPVKKKKKARREN